MQGSSFKAGCNVSLTADNRVKLSAAQNTFSQASANRSSACSIGASYGTDRLLLNLSASGAKGKSNGNDTHYSNTRVDAGNVVVAQSGADTTLSGAVVEADTVIARVGGNLNIERLQDTSTYTSKTKAWAVASA